MKRTALYIRVSTQEQAEEGFSIPAQKERLIAYCKARGWLVSDIYIDPGYSGSNLERPGIKNLIKNIDKYDVVLVYKLDRISRSQADTMFLLETIFLPSNISLVSLMESFDTGTPFGRAMVGILAVFAQLERDNIRERSAMGMYERAKLGKYHGSTQYPIGYRPGDDGHYVVEPYEAMQVKKAFELYASGFGGLQKVAKELNRLGYKHMYGSWYSGAVGNAISNRIYLGELSYLDLVVKDAHEPIVSEELFDAANAILSSNNKAFRSNSQYLLSSLLYCGHCGARMLARGGDDRRGSFYSCYSVMGNSEYMVKDLDCIAEHVPIKMLDTIVDYAVRSLVMDESYLQRLIEDEVKASAETSDSEEAIMAQELDKVERQIDRLMDLYQDDRFPVEVVAGRIGNLYDQRKMLKARLDKIVCGKTKKETSAQNFLPLISNAAAIWDEADVLQKRFLLRAMIDKIVVFNDKVDIYWSFSPNEPETFLR